MGSAHSDQERALSDLARVFSDLKREHLYSERVLSDLKRTLSDLERVVSGREGPLRPRGSIGRYQVRSHLGQARSECRVGGGPDPVRLQRTDEVTVEYRRLSNQVTHVRRGYTAEEAEFPAPVGTQRTDEVTLQKREVSSQAT